LSFDGAGWKVGGRKEKWRISNIALNIIPFIDEHMAPRFPFRSLVLVFLIVGILFRSAFIYAGLLSDTNAGRCYLGHAGLCMEHDWRIESHMSSYSRTAYQPGQIPELGRFPGGASSQLLQDPVDVAPPGDVERGSGGGALRTPIFSKGLPRRLVDINIEASTEVKAADPLRARNPARSNGEGLP
jgi:hypothetical protein